FSTPLTTQPVNRAMESNLCLHLAFCAQSSVIVDEGSSSAHYMHEGTGPIRLIPRCASLIILVQHAVRRWSFDARDCALRFVDRPDIMTTQVLECGPRHDL